MLLASSVTSIIWNLTEEPPRALAAPETVIADHLPVPVSAGVQTVVLGRRLGAVILRDKQKPSFSTSKKEKKQVLRRAAEETAPYS